MFICSYKLSKFFCGKYVITVLLLFTVLITTSFGVLMSHIGEEYFEKTSVYIDSAPIIILDAGHGGEDSGAQGVGGVLEKNLNLAYALTIGEMLEKQGYTVVYTRKDDKLLYGEDENIKGLRKISDLKNRCKIANAYKDAIFVSIHMNSFGSEKYSGLQVYYSENVSSARMVADSVQNKVRELIQPENKRKIKNGEGIYLLENINVPAILIECGFLTNREECKKLSEKEYQKQLSFSIVCGIIEYIRNN